MGFRGSADVGLADDFDQRRAAAVQVHVRIPVRILEPIVDALARVILHVDPRDTDPLRLPVRGAIDNDINMPVLGQRPIVLRNLEALRQVQADVGHDLPITPARKNVNHGLHG